MQAHLDVHFGVAAPRNDRDEPHGYAQRSIDELASLTEPLRLPPTRFPCTGFTLREVYLDDCPGTLRRQRHCVQPERFFHATATLDLDMDDFRRYCGGSLIVSEPRQLYLSAQRRGKRFLDDLALLANIARPGSLEVANMTLSIQEYDQLDDDHWMGSNIPALMQDNAAAGWVEPGEMPLTDVWRWAQSMPGFGRGLVKGRVGRALAVAGSFFDKNTFGQVTLPQVMSGVGALFVTAPDDGPKKIFARITKLLGRPRRAERLFAWACDYTARAARGGVDVELAHCRYEAALPSDFREVDKARTFATAVLFASLQRIAEKDWEAEELEAQLAL